MEPVQRALGTAHGALEHAGLVHSAAAQQRRTEAEERSAPGDRRALPEQRSLSRAAVESRAAADRSAVPARRGSRRHRAERGAALGLHRVERNVIDTATEIVSAY